ncbi:DUF4845 domain-containing protein [Moraxella sp. ZY210820]|uniref:DUF4845 domain-containing protein n=1 Tax=unclassified Moraxella TaxID=2685852 RepID=UPI0027310DD5|nr:DUF4845 domain-containing protein [Moraxella sp. ZY210820]WLF83162.1 DUF4845 domain-containing protein [Moraxella sp. ZY210820]
MRKFQQGSASGIMAMVILFCLALKIGAALFPAFLDDRMINQQIQELVTASNQQTIPQKFISDLDNRLSMNNIRDLKASDIMKVTQTGQGIQVHKNYEIRAPFVMNVDFAVKFEKKFDKSTAQ